MKTNPLCCLNYIVAKKIKYFGLPHQIIFSNNNLILLGVRVGAILSTLFKLQLYSPRKYSINTRKKINLQNLIPCKQLFNSFKNFV